ncbi:MAG: NADAR family protein [Lachnospiraceae bacterium]|nr:NADAR family protein [Lachnospiraceae bacterium]
MIAGFRNEYYFLSNFYICNINYNGKTYQSAEAAFQAQKSLDENIQWQFTGLSPRDARTQGKRVPLRPDWEEVKEDIMKEILIIKFSKPELKEKLLETGDEFLEETNGWHDNHWGNCNCERCRNIPGKNMLGNLLMDVRKNFQEEIFRNENPPYMQC